MTLPGPRIVVATGGSGASRRATEAAARLASAFAAELTIVHVVPAAKCRTGRLAPTLPIARRLEDPATKTLKNGPRGRLRIDYGDPHKPGGKPSTRQPSPSRSTSISGWIER
jgi:nucleotide-binding universal stress UspA family protein